MIKYLCIPILAGFIVIGCQSNPDKPKDLIKEPVYIDVLTEVFMAQSLAELKDITEQEDSLVNVVFDRYAVSRDQFERSHKYYQRQGEAQLVRTDSIRSILRNEREALIRARQEQRDQESGQQTRQTQREQREQRGQQEPDIDYH
jgi:hypothetical protein